MPRNTEQGAVATWWRRSGAQVRVNHRLWLPVFHFFVEYRAGYQVATAPCSVLSAAEAAHDARSTKTGKRPLPDL